MTFFVSFEQARDLAFGREEWWKCTGRYGERIDEEQLLSDQKIARQPVRYKHNRRSEKGRSTMYVGGWRDGDCHGFGVYYFEEGYVIAGTRAKNNLNPAKLVWLSSSPCWINNNWPSSVIRAREEDCDLDDEEPTGLPFMYLGSFVNGLMEDDHAAVILKDGTTRIGPWKAGNPVGDWWEDHEERYTTLEDLATLQSFGSVASDPSNEIKAIKQKLFAKESAFTAIRDSPTTTTVCSGSYRDSPTLQRIDEHRAAQPVVVTPTERTNLSSMKKISISDLPECTENDCSISDFGRSLATDVPGKVFHHESTLSFLDQNSGILDDKTSAQEITNNICNWLSDDVIGTDADPVDIYKYATKFQEDGFHSVEMIQRSCTLDDIAGWMKKAHIRVFIEKAFVHRSEVTTWLSKTVIPNADIVEVEVYRQQFFDEGLNSVDAIKTMCTPQDIEGFTWMKKFHRRSLAACISAKGEDDLSSSDQ
ncbi:hypothetical protein FisN_5Hh432 [Fistulifera solaris]|uniref:Uncharacterized protein n=1 Tax=Fistulifera solaris TaxID=1519565 RepID=A0A1Z5JSP6_FISSO|nr:hypothetical protein FisN_5Hh432 [Fistulifera solaris]|eukprot:GAX17047.1 hypothetical protein FisN_5Hh432 [Fistulifera solaris]